MNEAGFFEQERELQHVRNTVGLGDDRRADRASAIGVMNRRRGLEYAKLGGRLVTVGKEGRDERTRRCQFPPQQFNTFRFVYAFVVEAGGRSGQKLGDGALMHIRVLPQINRSQAEPEQVDRALQRP